MEMNQIIAPATPQTQASPQPQGGKEATHNPEKSAFASLLELVAGAEKIDAEAETNVETMTDGSVETPKVQSDSAENLLNVMVGLLHLPKAEDIPELTGVADSKDVAAKESVEAQGMVITPAIMLNLTAPMANPLSDALTEVKGSGTDATKNATPAILENIEPVNPLPQDNATANPIPLTQLPEPLNSGLLIPAKPVATPPVPELRKELQGNVNTVAVETPVAATASAQTSATPLTLEASAKQENPPARLKIVRGGTGEALVSQHLTGKEALKSQPQEPEESNPAAEQPKVEVVFRDAKQGGAQQGSAGEQGLDKNVVKTKVNNLTTDFTPLVKTLESELQPQAKSVVEASKSTPIHDSIMDQVKQGIAAQGNREKGEISIRLNPAELGELKINVRLEDQKLKVDVITDNPVVKEALLQNLDGLKENLSRQNLAMSGFNVSTGGSQAGQTFQENKGMMQGQPQHVAGKTGSEAETGDEQIAYEYGDTRDDALVDVRF